VVTSVTILISCSSARGITRTIAMPTAGRKTARVSAQSSNQLIATNLLFVPSDVEDEEQEAQEPDSREQEQRVPLHAPRLQVPEEATGLAGHLCHPVERTVDHPLVDDVVHEPPGTDRALARAVDDAVDHVLVEPVHAPCDRSLDRRHDHVLV